MINYFFCNKNILTHTHLDDRACSLEPDMIGM